MKKHLQMLAVALVLALFAGASFAEITLKVGPNLDDDDGATWALSLAGNEPSGVALTVGQSLHDPGKDDGRNAFIGADYFFKVNVFRLALGAAYWQKPLHLTSERLNAHLGAAAVFPVNRALSVGVYLDHWSNCRRICNHDVNEIKNHPRNVLSVGLSLPL